MKKSIEEEEEEGEHEIDVSSTNVKRDDRAVKEEQDDMAIPEKETSPIVVSSPLIPSPDNFIMKLIRYSNYNLKSMIDRYPNLRADRKAFSAYPWDRISYDITINHLLKAVKTIDGKTTNLYHFPWAVMCWAFEIVHPWIIPTSSEMEMEFFTKHIIIDEHNLDVGGGGASSPIVERVFSGVGEEGGGEFTPIVERVFSGVGDEGGGEFTPNVDRLMVLISIEEETSVILVLDFTLHIEGFSM
ncbi:hypothetical protein KY285_001288 [Solanum tuberosum]|nr:hypothetical protein KY285_001288 [Solanum tuberosum]